MTFPHKRPHKPQKQNQEKKSGKKPAIPGIGPIFLTLFIDLMGFSLIFTVIPDLLLYYLPALAAGADQTNKQLDAISRWLISYYQYFSPSAQPGGHSLGFNFGMLTMVGAFLSGLYSLMQFVFAPFWGSVSDRLGRRKTLIITVGLNGLSYLLWAVSTNFTWFLVSRILSGFFSGNISVATAAVSDITSEKNRTRGMGFVGMAIGFGFVVGAPLGGIFAKLDLSHYSSYLHPFSSIGLAGAILSFFNLYQILTGFPETKQTKSQAQGWPLSKLFSMKKGVDFSDGFRLSMLLYLLVIIAFSAFESTMVFFFSWHLGYSPNERILLFSYTGILLALVQGGLSRIFSGKVKERTLILIGIVLFIPGFLFYATAAHLSLLLPHNALALIGLTLIVFSAGTIFPPMTSLSSFTLSAHHQGMGLGLYRSMGALGRIIGPFAGGWIYLHQGPAMLFAYCLVLMVSLLFLAQFLPKDYPFYPQVTRP